VCRFLLIKSQITKFTNIHYSGEKQSCNQLLHMLI